MVIRIDSLENIIADTAYYLGKTAGDLLRDIEKINFRSGDVAGYRYISENKSHLLKEVYLCHVTRKLNTANYVKLLPLSELLTTHNAFSDFLEDHHISFDKPSEKIDKLIYKGRVIDWETSDQECFNPARFHERLTRDFCVNGFQFLYDIPNSAQPDYNLYSHAPEFLQDLDYLLETHLVSDFRANSRVAVALCRFPIEKIVFASNSEYDRFEERYIFSTLGYIWEYCYSKCRRGSNCKLRALDDYTVPVERWIPEEEIECYL